MENLSFKSWLLSEDGSDFGGSSWDLIYPTKASDYEGSTDDPKAMWFLQWAWNRGIDLGRPLINIDTEQFNSIGYKSVYSKTMPALDAKWWHHKPDSGSSIEIDNNAELVRFGYASDPITPLIMKDSGIETHRMGKDGYNLPSSDLDKVFGDEHKVQHPDGFSAARDTRTWG